MKLFRRARYRALHWALGHTATGRAILFNHWVRGYETGKRCRGY